MPTNERATQIRRNKDSLVSACSGNKRKYAHHKASAKKESEWNNGALVGSSVEAQLARAKMLDTVSKVSGQETKVGHNAPRDSRLNQRVSYAPAVRPPR